MPPVQSPDAELNRTEIARAVRGAWVAPIVRPPIRDGAVRFRAGRIDDVGPATEVLRGMPVSSIEDLGPDSVLLPGLVNAHAHLELSDLSPSETSPASLADWLIALMARLSARRPGDVTAAVARGIEQCVQFGVTTVADVTADPLATRPIARAGPVRVISFGELRAMAKRRGQLEPRLAAAVDPSNVSETLRVGLSPHAPYSVEIDAYRHCVETARAMGLPITTHLAEAPDEAQFLAAHSGSLRTVWDFLGDWDDAAPRFDGGPIRMAKAVGLLGLPACVLAHVNYCDDAELEILASSRATVAYCPRTHAHFDHPPHRWREMLARGINVVVGTDSCASSPDLNLVDDLCLLRRLAPEVSAATFWEMATIRGALALGVAGDVGSLTAGKRADFVCFAAGRLTHDPLAFILDQTIRPDRVWVGGEERKRELATEAQRHRGGLTDSIPGSTVCTKNPKIE